MNTRAAPRARLPLPRRKRTPTVNLNPLEAILTDLAATIANKGLTDIVSPLDATLTKYHEGAL